MITIETIKSWLDDFVANGGKVDDLGNNHKLYRQIKDADIFENGTKLSTEQKFQRAGHPRSKHLSPKERGQKMVDDFFAAGGKVEDIKKGTEIYEKIKNLNIVLPNGKRVPMNDKLIMFGVKRPPRRVVSIEEISRRLQEFVDAGGNIDDLGVEDELYQLVKGIDNKHSLVEKFKMCGQLRRAKKVKSVTEKLKIQAFAYIAAGGSLHIPRKQLPFYETLHAAKRAYLRRTGKHISSKDMLASIGIKGYSDIYFNYLKIFELSSYQDTYGFVDNYRKDGPLNATIDRYAEQLGMPIALVVELVGDQKLERCCLQTDTLSYISKQLVDYKQIYGSFENISRTDPQLYNRLCRLKRIVSTDNGKPISTKELVELLGSYDNADVFSDTTEIRELDYEADIVPLVTHARNHGNQISAKDIPHSLYRSILDHALRHSTTISDFFDDFGVEYIDARQNQMFVKLYVETFPYIHEMKQERDILTTQLQNEHPEFTKEEFFEGYLEICKSVYSKYKEKIASFGLNSDFDSSTIKKSAPTGLGE